MSGRPIRVLIVHDSPTVRASLRRTIESAADFAIVGELSSAEHIVGAVETLEPHVVVMDVVMPGVDGWAATRALMERRPVPVVLVSQVVDPRDARVALEAIRAGALAIADPPPPPDDAARSFRRDGFLALLRSAAQIRPSAPPPAPPDVARPMRARSPAAAIAVVASTGGPAALMSILEALPAGEFAPLLIVQHLARGFADGLARWLASTGHPVQVARESMAIERGHVYIAPDDRHLGIDLDRTLTTSSAPALSHVRPAATWLLQSMGRSLGTRGAAVILTGMGEDGAEGAVALRSAGGDVVAQDEQSCVVFGMPEAAIRRGAVSEVLPLTEIARWIVEKSVKA